MALSMASGADNPSVDPRLARLVAQHARTSRLLGVDFVPSFRASGSDDGSAQDSGGDAGAGVGSVVELKRAATADAPVVVRPHPLPAGAALARSEASPSGAVSREDAQRLLDELRARYEREAPHAPFITSFTNIVFGEGDPRARLMFVGEAPGEQEDLTGRPFVGRAGDLLQRMITAMGLTRESVYIANVLKVRPPNNATPTIEEAQASAPFLFEQIDIVRPEAIVTLGLPASRLILDTTASMGSLRGLWATFTTPSGHRVPVMPTYHPAFLLRAYTTENRAKVWSDLQKVVERLGLATGG